jgi:hypothetical protein
VNDLRDSKFIYLKGCLFFIALIVSIVLILIDSFSWKTVILLCLIVWSSARLYYFMFYVIEKYVDPSYKFSGILSFISYLINKKK